MLVLGVWVVGGKRFTALEQALLRMARSKQSGGPPPHSKMLGGGREFEWLEGFVELRSVEMGSVDRGGGLAYRFEDLSSTGSPVLKFLSRSTGFGDPTWCAQCGRLRPEVGLTGTGSSRLRGF